MKKNTNISSTIFAIFIILQIAVTICSCKGKSSKVIKEAIQSVVEKRSDDVAIKVYNNYNKPSHNSYNYEEIAEDELDGQLVYSEDSGDLLFVDEYGNSYLVDADEDGDYYFIDNDGYIRYITN